MKRGSNPLIYRDVLPLITRYLNYTDYTNLKQCCKPFGRYLGYYQWDKTIHHFRDAVIDFIRRVKRETGVLLKVDIDMVNWLLTRLPTQRMYYSIGPFIVIYPIGRITLIANKKLGYIWDESVSHLSKYITK